MSESGSSGAQSTLHSCLSHLAEAMDPFFSRLCALDTAGAHAILATPRSHTQSQSQSSSSSSGSSSATSALLSSISFSLSFSKSKGGSGRSESKIWEEITHPLKLLADCERNYYAWQFLAPLPPLSTESGSSSSGGGGLGSKVSGSSSGKKKDGGGGLTCAIPSHPVSARLVGGNHGVLKQKGMAGEDMRSLVWMYSQLPLGLKKTQAALTKLMPIVTGGSSSSGSSTSTSGSGSGSASGSGSGGHEKNGASKTSSSHRAPSTSTSQSQPPPPPPPPLALPHSLHLADRAALSAAAFASLHHLFDELMSVFIPLRQMMIDLYALLALPYAQGPMRVRSVESASLAALCQQMSSRCNASFRHPLLQRMYTTLIHPELSMLGQVWELDGGGGEGEGGGSLDRFQWRENMFSLWRLRREMDEWTSTLEAAASSSSSSSTMHTDINAKGKGSAGSQSDLHRSTSTLSSGSGRFSSSSSSPSSSSSSSTSTFTLPSVLHWLRLFHASLLAKSTFIFWHPIISTSTPRLTVQNGRGGCGGRTSSSSASSRERERERAELAAKYAKLERLDTNFLAAVDRLLQRVPCCSSFSLLLDCSNRDQVVAEPAHSLASSTASSAPRPTRNNDDDGANATSNATNDTATTRNDVEGGNDQDDADGDDDESPPPPTGGLARYPILFTWPLNRSLEKKWNVVSLLLSKQDVWSRMSQAFANYHPSSRGSTTSNFHLPLPSQSSSYLLAVGPSFHPSDLIIWDYEHESMKETQSYVLAKMDLDKDIYIVITCQPPQQQQQQQQSGNEMDAATLPPSGSSTSLGAGPSHLHMNASPPSNISSSTAPSSSAAATATPPPSRVALFSPAIRKRLFDVIVSELYPMLQRLRHQHVYAQVHANVHGHGHGAKRKG